MFQYTKDVILHDIAKRVEVVDATNQYSGVATKKLVIKRAGEYFADYILPATIYATEGKEGDPGVLTMDFADIFKTGDENTPNENYPSGPYAAGLYQLQFRMKTPNQFYAEFANPMWKPFGQPILVGFDVTDDIQDDAAKVAEKVAKLINLTMAADNRYMDVKVEDTKVIVTGTNNYMTFDKAVLEKYDPTVCDSCLGEYNIVKVFDDITDNVEPFATGEWIQQNLRFPTYANIRYESPNADETPRMGEIYTQYSFAYQSPRPGLGGQSGVGQGMTAVTRHIFYVASAEKVAFEAELAKLGVTIKADENTPEETPEVVA